MRMVIEAACVGVQDGGCSGRSLQLRVGAGERLYRFPTAPGQD